MPNPPGSIDLFPAVLLAVTDGRDPDRRVLRAAGRMATATQSELHIVHIKLVARGIYPDFMSDRHVNQIEAEARENLETDLAFARDNDMTVANSHVRLGRFDREALKTADEIGAGMIVVANRTGDAFERILLGDESETIVRHARCPVLVIRAPDS